MSVLMRAADGHELIVRTSATSEGRAYRSAQTHCDREHPGRGYLPVRLAL